MLGRALPFVVMIDFKAHQFCWGQMGSVQRARNPSNPKNTPYMDYLLHWGDLGPMEWLGKDPPRRT